MIHPSVSVIIPTYKPKDYFAQCIDSVAQQTLSKELYEVIIVLNGCDEPYHGMISNLLHTYTEVNIELFQMDTQGVSNARNIGLDNAKGDFIAFIDDDDWVSPNYLENLLRDSCEGITQANLRMIDEYTNEKVEHYVSKAYVRCSHYSKLNLVNSRKFLSSVWCKLIPREVIGDTRFDVAYSNGEDALFMFAISKRISSIRLAKNDTFYYVRRRIGSASRQQMGYIHRCRLALKLMWRFTTIEFGDTLGYNFFLYLTRIAATIKRYVL